MNRKWRFVRRLRSNIGEIMQRIGGQPLSIARRVGLNARRVRFASKARSGRKMAGEGVWNRGETVIVRYMVSTWIGTQIGN